MCMKFLELPTYHKLQYNNISVRYVFSVKGNSDVKYLSPSDDQLFCLVVIRFVGKSVVLYVEIHFLWLQLGC